MRTYLSYGVENRSAIFEVTPTLGTDTDGKRGFLLESLGQKYDAIPGIGIQGIDFYAVVTQVGLGRSGLAKKDPMQKR
jgi:hypothetical protein